MREKPILFNSAMVQAILEGRKTQTRRIIKQPFEIHQHTDGLSITHPKQFNGEYCRFHPYNPPYDIGDTLWVRETFYAVPSGDPNTYVYKADETQPDNFHYWKPSIHMPREAARLFLKVKNVRAEQLQDITEGGAKAEGIKLLSHVGKTIFTKDYRNAFKTLWDSIYHNWSENPWVWVIEFEKE